MLASTLIIGFPIGIAQWIALRRVAPVSITWVMTITIGLLLALIVLKAVPDRTWGIVDDESNVSITAIYTFFGFVVGLAQWFLLRSQFTKSVVWLIGSSVGAGLGTGLVLASGLINQSGILSIILAVLVYAGATGLALGWLHDHHAESRSRLRNAT